MATRGARPANEMVGESMDDMLVEQQAGGPRSKTIVNTMSSVSKVYGFVLRQATHRRSNAMVIFSTRIARPPSLGRRSLGARPESFW